MKKLLLALSLLSTPAIANTTGIASFYRSTGNLTASGERFNPHEATVATRHFKLGSRIKIVNLENNRSVIARVNDRTPKKWSTQWRFRGRVVDVTEGVANRLGFKRDGLTEVAMYELPHPFKLHPVNHKHHKHRRG